MMIIVAILIILIIIMAILVIKKYLFNNKKMTLQNVYKLEKKGKLMYKSVVLSDIIKNYPKKVQGLTFGYICPGAMKTVEYLNKVLRQMPEGKQKIKVRKITGEIKTLTDFQFFVEIFVIYKKYIEKSVGDKMETIIKKDGCPISELITDRITVLFGELPVKIKRGLPDDFYHIRHNTLICSKNKTLANKRIELLKSIYGNTENFVNICDGKRDGVSGCRDCCSENFKQNNKYRDCVNNCMNR